MCWGFTHRLGQVLLRDVHFDNDCMPRVRYFRLSERFRDYAFTRFNFQRRRLGCYLRYLAHTYLDPIDVELTICILQALLAGEPPTDFREEPT